MTNAPPSQSVSRQVAGTSHTIQQRLCVLERRRTKLHVPRKLDGLDRLGGLKRPPESLRSQQDPCGLVCVGRKSYLFNCSILAASSLTCGCSSVIPSAASGLESSLNVSS